MNTSKYPNTTRVLVLGHSEDDQLTARNGRRGRRSLRQMTPERHQGSGQRDRRSGPSSIAQNRCGRVLAAIIFVAVSCAACGDDAPQNAPRKDLGEDISIDANDMSEDQVDLGPDMAEGTLCQPCVGDASCVDGRCVGLIAEGERVCGRTCVEDDESSCPNGYFCAPLEGGEPQCLPQRLTCVDRCGDVTCEGQEVCDPFSGECKRPLRLCEPGCVSSELCGDGPEDVCLAVPNTPDNERICATGCDPQAETRECPADFGCVSLDPENDPSRGVCFPLRGTCTDRCQTVDCPDGENCDPVTGSCSAARYGACEPGCTNSTECLGQADVCLDLGIGDGTHCWQSCEDVACAEGYECAALVGTTLSVCIPLGRDCTPCENTTCFPNAICNPVDAQCVPIQTDCNVAGCLAGFVCNVTTTECQAVDQACSGDSWAIDCDNVVTRCTTQRPGTSGVCAQVCTADADCTNGSCINTNLGKLCLPQDMRGAQSCGSLYRAGSDVGRACRPGFCRNAAPMCLVGVGATPYCSKTCTTGADCGVDERCGAGPSGGLVCIPTPCECSGYHGLPAGAAAALDDALTAADLGTCSLVFELRDIEEVAELNLALLSPFLERLAAYPLRALGLREQVALAAQAATATATIENASGLQDAPVVGVVSTFAYPGAESKLTQAVAALIVAGGGVPDLAALELEAASVPVAAQELVAPIVLAVAEAYTSRNAALSAAGWQQSDLDQAYEGMPYVFLAGTPTQVAAAPDFMDQSVRDQYRTFPSADFNQIAADLSATIEDAVANAPDTTGLSVFGYVVSTPAGLVIIGDASATTFDPSVDSALAGGIAVLVDLGGDDTYRLPVAANRPGVGASVMLDLGGDDTYSYVKQADPNDAMLLVSDSEGRVPPLVPVNQGDGPISASDQGRQASARVGIALMWDLGAGDDTYESLRMSQAAAVLGVAVLWDDGGVDTYAAEALSQGASIAGLALFHDRGVEGDTYISWHASQGFAAGSGVGWLSDQGGADTYEAVAGTTGRVLYFSPTDRGVSNRNLSQGAAVGVAGSIAGGLGALVDSAGSDTYTIGTYGQAYAAYRGAAYLINLAGDDIYEGRGVVQGVGEWAAGAFLFDGAGDDQYNPTSPRRQLGQGVGQLAGWGVLFDAGGADTVNYIAPAGGVGIDGGFGAAIFEGGVTAHTAASNATWGFAQNAPMMPPFDTFPTLGLFIDAGGAVDVYQRPNLSVVGDDKTWRQPDAVRQTGFGTDR